MERIAFIGIDDFSIKLIELLKGKVKYISVIDSDAAKVDAIWDDVNLAVAGNIEKSDILISFLKNSENIDTAFISTGKNMSASILAAYHLTESRIQNIYAKVNNDDHAKILKEIGVNNIIFPEEDTAKLLLSKLIKSPDV